MGARISSHLCPKFQTAAELLGKRWTPLILHELDQPRRYSELAEALDIVSERMLIQRLKELEGAGVVERQVIDEQPVRVIYRLTEKGRALGRVVGSLQRWAEQWIAHPGT